MPTGPTRPARRYLRGVPVVLAVLDAFPNAWVSPETTPTLWSLAAEGGRNPEGGLAELTAATYPNHATFVTGRSAVDHGIVTNRVQRDGRWVSSAETGPEGPTLFDGCARAGRRAVAAFGDQHLVGVCGAAKADAHWPPNGAQPEGARRNATGYLADDEVVAAAHELDLASADFVFMQLDSVDATRHMTGAFSEESREQCRATDAALGALLEPLRAVWNETVVIAVSDHDQEDLLEGEPLDLRPHLPEGCAIQDQGTAALVVGTGAADPLRQVAGVEGVESLDARHHVVWGAPGQRFGTRSLPIAADHGSPRTRAQVAVVGGGAPAASALAHRIERERPAAGAWAGWIAELLGLDGASRWS